MKYREAYDEYIEAVERKALPAAIAIVRLTLSVIDKSTLVDLGDGRKGGFLDIPLADIRSTCLTYGIVFTDENFELFVDYFASKVSGHSPNPTCYTWDIAHALGHILTEEDGGTIH